MAAQSSGGPGDFTLPDALPVLPLPDGVVFPLTAGPEVDGLRRAVVDLFRKLIELSPDLPDELAGVAESFTDPRQVVYFAASLARMDTATRQALLEADSVADKLRRLVDVLQG